MTEREFKEIYFGEYPKINAMVKTVKALGAVRVSCDVFADGDIIFTIRDKEKVMRAFCSPAAEKEIFVFSDTPVSEAYEAAYYDGTHVPEA